MKRKKIFWNKKGFICCIPVVAIIIVLVLLAVGVITFRDIVSYLIWLGIIAIGWYIWKLWKDIKFDEKNHRPPNYYKRNYRLP
ncbi:hypothetical protein HYY70_04855 [Candidatus Woesearchaeota archaeon]|nr:hypothetical protein [Candidatus Woesearchaeota archaeon]